LDAKSALHERVGVAVGRVLLDDRVPKQLCEQIMALARKANWSGRGSRAIRKGQCLAAIEFIRQARSALPDLPFPRFGPSVEGGVPLTWRLGEVSFTVHVTSSNPAKIAFMQADTSYHPRDGVESWKQVISRMGR
jgi:hypothetical protein